MLWKTKRDLELVSSGSSGYIASSEKFIKVILLPDQVWHVIWSSFWVIPKIMSATLCKPIQHIIKYSPFICRFESGKSRKEAKKYKHLNILWTKIAF